jgi:hypothetical protein
MSMPGVVFRRLDALVRASKIAFDDPEVVGELIELA